MSFFFKQFNASFDLREIKDKPFENGLKFLSEFFRYWGINDEKKIMEALGLFTPSIYRKGDMFLREGEVCNKIGFTIKGAVEIFLQSKGIHQTLLMLTEEDFYTDLKSFLHQQPSALNIEFAEYSIVFEISYENFRECIKNNPEFGDMFMKIMSNVAAAITQLNMTLKLPMKKRYQKLLKLQPQIFNRFLLQDIATLMGVKQETLSRIRSQLKNDNTNWSDEDDE